VSTTEGLATFTGFGKVVDGRTQQTEDTLHDLRAPDCTKLSRGSSRVWSVHDLKEAGLQLTGPFSSIMFPCKIVLQPTNQSQLFTTLSHNLPYRICVKRNRLALAAHSRESLPYSMQHSIRIDEDLKRHMRGYHCRPCATSPSTHVASVEIFNSGATRSIAPTIQISQSLSILLCCGHLSL